MSTRPHLTDPLPRDLAALDAERLTARLARYFVAAGGLALRRGSC